MSLIELHGTLSDADGHPKVYKALGPDSVPLAEAAVWPDDMSDWEAVRHAADIEFGPAVPGPWLRGSAAARRWHYVGLRDSVPLSACRGEHTATMARCHTCGAER